MRSALFHVTVSRVDQSMKCLFNQGARFFPGNWFQFYLLKHSLITWLCLDICRVRGIKGLRVIDASIIPNSLSGNSYTTQVMIAEKAADIVRDKDTVQAIKAYFKHLMEVKHKRIMEEDDHTHHTNGTIYNN